MGGFYIVMNVSNLPSLGVSKEPGLGMELIPLFIPRELLSVLSKCAWLLRLEGAGELDHEVWKENNKTFSLAPGLFVGGYQCYFYSQI